MARDDFAKSVVEQIERRAGHRCSMPNCRRATSSPNPIAPDRSIKKGVAAHITAASRGGPRFDATLTPEERASVDNGVWMCQNCARVIDVSPNVYTVDFLRAIKQDAERRAAREAAGADLVADLIADLVEFNKSLLDFISECYTARPMFSFSRSEDELERQRHWDHQNEILERFYNEARAKFCAEYEPAFMALLPRIRAILGESDPDYVELIQESLGADTNLLSQASLARQISKCIGALGLR